MKKRLLKISLALILVTTLALRGDVFNGLFQVSTVRAYGDLSVDYHVATNAPIFTVTNMKPGDSQTRSIDVTNSGILARYVSIKGNKTGGTVSTPYLENVLDIVIKDGSTTLYGGSTGAKTVADFFNDSASKNGILLDVIASGAHTTYTITVTFPTAAGNEYQEKSVVFDIAFGYFTSDNIVINEVYYNVDNNHGMDSQKDRGILGFNGVTVTISGNGPGSKNIVNVSLNNYCNMQQTNTSNINNNIHTNISTGDNVANGNTNSIVSIVSGAATSLVNIVNQGSSNTINGGCVNQVGQDDEWVELFNPTDHNISLKNWTLTDNSGSATVIHANKTIKAGGFALLSKSAATWKYWNTHNAEIIELGSQIGDGLDNAGDHLILKNAQGSVEDKMSWGSDTTGFTPPAVNPLVSLGLSTARKAPGFDTDMASDWQVSNPPTPGF